jgi:predicted ATP-dependent Lon-type protease
MQNQKLLSGGGVWCIVNMGYSHEEDIKVRWIIEDVKPIQVSTFQNQLNVLLERLLIKNNVEITSTL